MIVRNCSGGIVFYEDSVLLLLTDKHEWVFPKGVIRGGEKMTDVAIDRVKIEAGIDASIVAPCGKSHYEFFSVTRQKPVHNNVSWFVMTTTNNNPVADKEEGFEGAYFVSIEKALNQITYSQDKSLLMMAYQRYKEII